MLYNILLLISWIAIRTYFTLYVLRIWIVILIAAMMILHYDKFCNKFASFQAEVPLVFSAFKMSGYTPSQVSFIQLVQPEPAKQFLWLALFTHALMHCADLSALGEAVFLELSWLEWNLSLSCHLCCHGTWLPGREGLRETGREGGRAGGTF